jgi:hypothetical protein
LTAASPPPESVTVDLQTTKDVAQIVYYVALSIAGPIALIEYLKSRKVDRLANEYKIYDELDDRFFEYQKLALQYYDLDILDVPNNDPSLAFDKKRKQEMVAYAILFSLFERAYLMFTHQTVAFQERQWSGWKRFLDDFLRRESVRAAWDLSKGTYDTDFQAFMEAKIAEVVPKEVPPPPVTTPASVPIPAPVPVPAPAVCGAVSAYMPGHAPSGKSPPAC